MAERSHGPFVEDDVVPGGFGAGRELARQWHENAQRQSVGQPCQESSQGDQQQKRNYVNGFVAHAAIAHEVFYKQSYAFH